VTEQRPKRPDFETSVPLAQWANFLEARIKEETEAVNSHSLQRWWEVTPAGARRFGVQSAGGRLIASVLTGGGHWEDQETALHMVRNQPYRVATDLTAKLMFVNLLRSETLIESARLTLPLRMIARQFAEPFIDHPDHPEYEPPPEG
jgi:hypothetical protein